MNKKWQKITAYVLCLIVIGLTLLLFTGCKVLKTKHDAAKFEQIIKHDSVIVRVDSFHLDTLIVPGEPVYVDCDSVVRSAMDEVSAIGYKQRTLIKWKAPLETFIFDTVWQVKNHYMENTARVALLEREVEKGVQSSTKMKGHMNMWRGMTGILFLLLLLTLLFRRK